MLVILQNHDIQKTCRVCLKCICESRFADFENLLHLYENIAQVKVQKEENLPSNICEECRNELLKYNNFKQKCLDNERILQDYLKKIKATYQVTSELENDVNIASESSMFFDENSFATNSDINLNKSTIAIKKTTVRHNVQKSYKKHICIICKENFCSFAKLLIHAECHSTDSSVTCDKCSKQFDSYRGLFRHIHLHNAKPFLCYSCGKTFSRSSDFNVHLRMHTGEKPYKCKICNKRFKTSYMCLIHKRKHTGEKPFMCKICTKKFISSSHLYIHMRSHNKIKSFSCTECARNFSQEKDLEIHSSLHTGRSLFYCDSCGKSFNRKNNLQKHVKLHQGIKTHVCQTCSFAFSTSTQLKIHLRTHTGERPYQCDQCTAKFASSSGLSRHKKTHKNIKSTSDQKIQENTNKSQSFCTLNKSLTEEKFKDSSDSIKDNVDNCFTGNFTYTANEEILYEIYNASALPVKN